MARKDLALSILLVLLAQSGYSVASDIPDKPISSEELVALIKAEPHTHSKGIVLSAKLLGEQKSLLPGPYYLSLKRTTEIDGWDIWHHPEDNSTNISDLAEMNRDLIQKLYGSDKDNSLFSDEGSIKLSLAGLSVLATRDSLGIICGIPIARHIDYDFDQAPGIWAFRFESSKTRESCLEFGLIFAVSGLKLTEHDGLLVIEKTDTH
ncbi:MAG: hypothetical protein QNJ85_14850 [Gammaproteobacteria bacterium]|nr:hypothetical protein [Gammaproteobacteria bacterium]